MSNREIVNYLEYNESNEVTRDNESNEVTRYNESNEVTRVFKDVPSDKGKNDLPHSGTFPFFLNNRTVTRFPS